MGRPPIPDGSTCSAPPARGSAIWCGRSSSSTAPAASLGRATSTTTDLNDPRVFLPPFAGSDGHFASTSIPTWRFGWVAGIGGEVRLFGSNWLARLEYLHYDFGNSGSFSFPDPNNPLIVSRSSGDLTVDVVRVGLSYKLDRDPFAPDAAVFAGPPVRGLITKAPARVAVPWTWSGYYIGAHAGYGWGRGNEPFDSRLLPAGVPVSGVDSKGFVVGFQAGANWQSGPLVGGLEIDLAGAGIKGSGSTAMVAVPGFVTTLSQATRTDKFDRLGSARARLGYLVSPGMLLYGTAGLGWTRFVNSLDGVTAASAVTPHWLFGWVAGVGLEKRLGETNWLARVEYLHYDFGDSGSFSQTGGGVAISTTSGRLTNDVVRTALSYKLDWPEFIAARHSSMLVKGSVAAPWSWSGFYVGGHAGYGWGRDPFEELAAAFQPANFPAVILHGLNSRGFVGGFQAGANWQDRSVVGGLEIDLSWSGIKGSTSTAGISNIGDPVAMTHTDKLDLLGSARARLGYLAWPSVLFYATGGLAWTRLEQTVDRAFPGLTIQTTTPSWRFGWVAGAGAQARLWKTNWLARVEYLHYDFGNSGNLVEGFTTNGALDSPRQRQDVGPSDGRRGSSRPRLQVRLIVWRLRLLLGSSGPTNRLGRRRCVFARKLSKRLSYPRIPAAMTYIGPHMGKADATRTSGLRPSMTHMRHASGVRPVGPDRLRFVI